MNTEVRDIKGKTVWHTLISWVAVLELSKVATASSWPAMDNETTSTPWTQEPTNALRDLTSDPQLPESSIDAAEPLSTAGNYTDGGSSTNIDGNFTASDGKSTEPMKVEEIQGNLTLDSVIAKSTTSATINPDVVTPVTHNRLSRVICTYNGSSSSRQGRYKFMVQNMSAEYCTDIYFNHAVISDENFGVQASSLTDYFPIDDNKFLPHFIAINDFKVSYPNLKTFLTVTDSDRMTFKSVVASPEKMVLFITSCRRRIRQWGFDGINIEWLYPEQARHLTTIVQRLRSSMNDEKLKPGSAKLQLGVTLAGNVPSYATYYEVNELSPLVDQMTLLVYDTPDYEKGVTKFLSLLYEPEDSMAPVGDQYPPSDHVISGDEEPNDNLSMAKRHSPEDDPSFSVDGAARPVNVRHRIAVPPSITDAVVKKTRGKAAPGASQATGDYEIDAGTSHTAAHNVVDAGTGRIVAGEGAATRVPGNSRGSNKEKRQAPRPPPFTVSSALQNLLKLGVDKSKINVAISLVGHSYALSGPTQYAINAPVSGPGTSSLNDTSGRVFYMDMCQRRSGGHLMRASSRDLTPFWYDTEEWITYEDNRSIAQKVVYVMDNHIGGIMIASQSEDDFSGLSCNNGKFSISKMVYMLSNVSQAHEPLDHTQPWQEYCGSSPTIWRLAVLGSPFGVGTNIIVVTLIVKMVSPHFFGTC